MGNINVDMPEDQHKHLRLEKANTGEKIPDIIIKAVKKYFSNKGE